MWVVKGRDRSGLGRLLDTHYLLPPLFPPFSTWRSALLKVVPESTALVKIAPCVWQEEEAVITRVGSQGLHGNQVPEDVAEDRIDRSVRGWIRDTQGLSRLGQGLEV